MTDRRFLLLTAACFALLALAWAGIFLGLLRRPNAYATLFHGMVRAKTAFAAAQPGPKLVVLGGSNVLFGFRAQTFQRLTGCPAANLGLTLPTGARYMIAQAESVLRPGDTLLVSFEYELFFDESPSSFLIQYVLAEDPDYYFGLPWWEKARWAFGVSPEQMKKLYAGGKNAELGGPVTGRRDAWGDAEENGEERRSAHTLDWMRHHRPEVYPAPGNAGLPLYAQIRRLHAWCAAHGVKLAATFPPLLPVQGGERTFVPLAAALETFYAQEGIPCLGTPWEALDLPENHFDSPYHLTRAGAEAHTAVIATELAGAGLIPSFPASGRQGDSR